jgi:phage FluMu protein Com
MEDNLNFFDSLSYLEPKCPKCKNKIEYDVTAKYDEKKDAMVCLQCGSELE